MDINMIDKVLNNMFPVQSPDGSYLLHYSKCRYDTSKVKTAVQDNQFLTIPILATFLLEHKTTGEFTETEVFLSDFPLISSYK